MPDPIKRDVAEAVVDEMLGERLRDLLAAEAARDTLRLELARWTSGQRRKGLPIVESVPDGIEYAARLARSIGTEGGEEHDRLLSEASQRMKALHDAAAHLIAEAVVLRAERDRLREAVRRLLDLYDSGNVLGTIAEIPKLRDALTEGDRS